MEKQEKANTETDGAAGMDAKIEANVGCRRYARSECRARDAGAAV